MEDGDTLFEIAQLYGVTVEAIVAANHLPDATSLNIGQVLIIPDPAFTPVPTAALITPLGGPASHGVLLPDRGGVHAEQR